jgi:hypothetical protein
MDEDGEPVLGYCTPSFLMLDVDFNTEGTVKNFADKYDNFFNLGGYLIVETSIKKQFTIIGQQLKSYAVIFGKALSFEEIKWHVEEAFKLGIVDKAFLYVRYFGSTTIRTSAKNKETPRPRIVAFRDSGDIRGVIRYLRMWSISKKIEDRKTKRR